MCMSSFNLPNRMANCSFAESGEGKTNQMHNCSTYYTRSVYKYISIHISLLETFPIMPQHEEFTHIALTRSTVLNLYIFSTFGNVCKDGQFLIKPPSQPTTLNTVFLNTSFCQLLNTTTILHYYIKLKGYRKMT